MGPTKFALQIQDKICFKCYAFSPNWNDPSRICIQYWRSTVFTTETTTTLQKRTLSTAAKNTYVSIQFIRLGSKSNLDCKAVLLYCKCI